MTGTRVRFQYRHSDQVATYDAQMVCVPRVGDTIHFADRTVGVAAVTWNLDPSIPADVIIDLA